MLQDRHAPDKVFESILKLTNEMDPVLAQIDQLLDDEVLYQLIRQELAQRYPKTERTGRPSTPVEVLLRMLAVKRLDGLSYEQSAYQVRDTLVLRQFCRIYLNEVPDDSTLVRWARLIQPTTLEAFNQRLTALARQLKVTQGRKLRTDGMVVESTIHYPTDSSLLQDGVRVLRRTLQRAKAVVAEHLENTATLCRDRTRSARQDAPQIGDASRKRNQEARATLRQSYQRLIQITHQSVRQAQQLLAMRQQARSQTAARVVQTLRTFLPRVEQVIEQTVRRLVAGESVPAAEKIVSLFEPHTDMIKRNKAHKPTEFGHKVWTDEVDGGIVSHWRVRDGNPEDAGQWQPALDAHLAHFEKPPDLMSGDRGLYSTENEAYATQQGGRRVILPKPGYKSQARRTHEQQGWFRRGRRWHVGVEGRISVLDRKFGLDRCPDKGRNGFQRYVGWGIIANNLTVIGPKVAA